MIPPRSLLYWAILTFMLSSQVKAQEPSLNTIVATVNGTTITLGHILDIKRQLPDQYQSLSNEVLFTNIVDQLVQQEILASSFTKDPEWVSITIQNERRNILSTIVIDKIREEAVSDEILKAAYLQKYSQIIENMEYRASHILVDTKEKAQDLLKVLEDGAGFSELAIKYSTGPSSLDGGDLGWFKKGQMVAPFETAVLVMDVGTYSKPIQTQFGYHLIHLVDRRETPPPTFEDVRSNLEIEIQNVAIDTYLRGKMVDADVTIPKNSIDYNKLSALDLQAK